MVLIAVYDHGFVVVQMALVTEVVKSDGAPHVVCLRGGVTKDLLQA